MRIGIIGGTGLYSFVGDKMRVNTEYGSVNFYVHTRDNIEVFFVSRHGEGHTFPPHRLNHRATLHAFHASHVERILAINTVGSMDVAIKPGSLFIPDDFINFSGTPTTFFDDCAVHVDMSEPFCPEIRRALIGSASQQGILQEGVYAFTIGPRFETGAEISMMQQFAKVVGMTLAPEATLARERGICYGSLCVVSNMAAGMQNKLPAGEIAAIYTKMKSMVMQVIDDAISAIPQKASCNCSQAAEQGKL